MRGIRFLLNYRDINTGLVSKHGNTGVAALKNQGLKLEG